METLPEHALRAWVDYLRDLGIYDLYRREMLSVHLSDETRSALLTRTQAQSASRSVPQTRDGLPGPSRGAAPSLPPRPPSRPGPAAAPSTPSRPLPGRSVPDAALPSSSAPEASEAEAPLTLPPDLAPPMPKPKSFDELAPPVIQPLAPAARAAALAAVRADIGDCTRCPLAYAGRHTIVFGDGDPSAHLLFVGEGPGADEDASGLPFVGKAGQLLNNMIAAMGLEREEVYIANIVKCRPPGNRTPEFVEANTCSQFLLRQIDIVQPQVIVALGGTAATYLLGVRQSLSSLRGQWHTVRGAKVAVTYHPAFLLRDPRQKGEAWKDLQRVMEELGLQSPRKPA